MTKRYPFPVTRLGVMTAVAAGSLLLAAGCGPQPAAPEAAAASPAAPQAAGAGAVRSPGAPGAPAVLNDKVKPK